MNSKWNVETIIKEIRQQDKKAPIVIKKNGKTVWDGTVWEGDSPPGPLILQPVSSYSEKVSYFLFFFRKVVWEINLQ